MPERRKKGGEQAMIVEARWEAGQRSPAWDELWRRLLAHVSANNPPNAHHQPPGVSVSETTETVRRSKHT